MMTWRLKVGWGRQHSGAVISSGKGGFHFGKEQRSGLKLGKRWIWVEELVNVAVRGTVRKDSTRQSLLFPHSTWGGVHSVPGSISTPTTPYQPPPHPPISISLFAISLFLFLCFLFLDDV